MEQIINSRNCITDFFNLSENPFVLTPDPKYLYLSHKHREVLAHLIYGIRESKGFMAVVGEVGTGKTTICRAFINQMIQEGLEIGFIYNPALTDLELLQSINREFKLPSDSTSKSQLIDTLNTFLLDQNSRDRKVVLLVDEAQNLQPSVLEQLRLISNLETETGKLIQIILVGQPELERILSRSELRQLDQRIVVRGLLTPLPAIETREYIRHRIRIAAAGKDCTLSFTDSACKRVYRLSGGIPRLINVLADRALLVAYAEEQRAIGASIVAKAHRDLSESRYKERRFFSVWLQRRAILLTLLMLALAGYGYQRHLLPPSVPKVGRSTVAAPFRPPAISQSASTKETVSPDTPPASSDATASAEQKTAGPEGTGADAARATAAKDRPVATTRPPEAIRTPHPDSDDRSARETADTAVQAMDRLIAPLSAYHRQANWQLALETIRALWNRNAMHPSVPVAGGPAADDLIIYRFFGNLNLLKSLNYPAILKVRCNGETLPVYVVLKKAEGDRLLLTGVADVQVAESALNRCWFGHAFIPWKDFETLPRVIAPGTRSESVTWLQRQLGALGFYKTEPNGYYDAATREAVLQLQRRYHLLEDGIVGPQTRMMLYALLKTYPNPTLGPDRNVTAEAADELYH